MTFHCWLKGTSIATAMASAQYKTEHKEIINNPGNDDSPLQLHSVHHNP